MKRSKFFLIMSGLFLTVVIAGFTRTLYLGSLFQSPDLPPHLTIHGIVLTIWFLLALVQPLLVARNQTQIHKRIGLAGFIIIVAVVAASLLTLAIRDAPTIDEFPGRAGGNLYSLFTFSFCAILGLTFKSRPDKHKRLMLLASIPLLAPALDRMARIPALNEFLGTIFSWFPEPPEIAFAILGYFGLIISVVVYDLLTDKRVHAGTIWGLGIIIAGAPAATAVMIQTGAWVALVRFVG